MRNIIKAGYEPIPCAGKRPVAAGWQDLPISLNTIGAWSSYYPDATNTGIRCATTPAADLDIYDPVVVEQVQHALLNLIPQQGTILKRVGQAPKRLIPFRCDTPFKKTAASMKAPDGIIHKVEVLCDGQQFIAEGFHPDIGKPYRWEDNVSLIEVAHERLSPLTEDIARQFVAEAVKIMTAAGWAPLNEKMDSVRTGAAPVEGWQQLAASDAGEGNRNETVAKLTGYLLRKFVDPLVALELMQSWNQARCRPPLPPDEIEQTVNSVCKKEIKRRSSS